MLNRNEELGQFELRRYLSFFGWESLSGLSDLLGDLQHQNHREALCDFLAERGRQHSHLVAKGLSDKRWYVVRNSVIIMCRIGDHHALTNLKRVVAHPDARVRRCLVDSLKDCRNVEALDLLTMAVRDTDPAIRKEAVNSIVAWRGEAAFSAITGIINDPSFAALEPGDKEAVLVAYSKLGGDMAVEYLIGLIKKPNVFRDSNLAILRTAAFEALTHNQSERCERALLKLTSSWRADVKQQAVEAIRRRRELMYGGTDA
jgi:HEAT repeat protein